MKGITNTMLLMVVVIVVVVAGSAGYLSSTGYFVKISVPTTTTQPTTTTTVQTNQQKCVGTYVDIMVVTEDTIMVTNRGLQTITDIRCYANDGTDVAYFNNLFSGEVDSRSWNSGSRTAVTCTGKCLTIGVSGECELGQYCWKAIPVTPTTLGKPVIEIDETATSCSGTTITVYVRNTGSGSTTLDNVLVYGENSHGNLIHPIQCDPFGKTITPGGDAVKCLMDITGSAGTNSIYVASDWNTVQATVYCPG